MAGYHRRYRRSAFGYRFRYRLGRISRKRSHHRHYRRIHRLFLRREQRANRRPTGAFIVIVYGIIQAYGLEGLAIATFMAGLILVLMGCFRLGTIIKFIPYPIVVGFTSGIALTIFATQIKDLLGLSMDSVPADFISKWVAYFQHNRDHQFLVAGHRNTQYSHHCLHSPYLQQNTGLPHGDYSHDRARLCARTSLGNRRK